MVLKLTQVITFALGRYSTPLGGCDTPLGRYSLSWAMRHTLGRFSTPLGRYPLSLGRFSLTPWAILTLSWAMLSPLGDSPHHLEYTHSLLSDAPSHSGDTHSLSLILNFYKCPRFLASSLYSECSFLFSILLVHTYQSPLRLFHASKKHPTIFSKFALPFDHLQSI